MTSSEQPKEYIITEKLTAEIEEYLKEKFPDYISLRIPRVIRSRPHPATAQEQDGCSFRAAKLAAMYDNKYVDGARKAREDLINTISAELLKWKNGLDYPNGPPGNTYDTVREFVESLRQQAGDPR